VEVAWTGKFWTERWGFHVFVQNFPVQTRAPAPGGIRCIALLCLMDRAFSPCSLRPSSLGAMPRRCPRLVSFRAVGPQIRARFQLPLSLEALAKPQEQAGEMPSLLCAMTPRVGDRVGFARTSPGFGFVARGRFLLRVLEHVGWFRPAVGCGLGCGWRDRAPWAVTLHERADQQRAEEENHQPDFVPGHLAADARAFTRSWWNRSRMRAAKNRPFDSAASNCAWISAGTSR